jgi:hypothetical protein
LEITMEAIQPAVEDQPTPPPNEYSPPQDHGAYSTEDRAYTLRMSEVVGKLLQDAVERNKQNNFIDVATWHLARIAECGEPLAMAHIVELLCYRFRYVAEYRKAEKEAAEARNAGYQPH